MFNTALVALDLAHAELWLTDPDGTLIEIYARLTDGELATKPADEQSEFLVPGTGQDTV